MKFEEGDVVELKSGSPLMTISYFEEIKSSEGLYAVCTWIENGEPKTMSYATKNLRIISDEEMADRKKKEALRKDAEAGITWFDIVAKWGTTIGAVGAFFLGILSFTCDKSNDKELKKLKEDISEIKQLLKDRSTKDEGTTRNADQPDQL